MVRLLAGTIVAEERHLEFVEWAPGRLSDRLESSQSTHGAVDPINAILVDCASERIGDFVERLFFVQYQNLIALFDGHQEGI